RKSDSGARVLSKCLAYFSIAAEQAGMPSQNSGSCRWSRKNSLIAGGGLLEKNVSHASGGFHTVFLDGLMQDSCQWESVHSGISRPCTESSRPAWSRTCVTT